MSPWLIAAAVLLVGFLPCLWVGVRGHTPDRLVAVQLATILATLIVLAIAAAEQRSYFADISLTLVLLSFPGTLVFAHFLERWL